MICNNCGKQLEEECLFCTECGSVVNSTEKQNQPTKKAEDNRIGDEIRNYIERFGSAKINKYLSVAAIISMISIRLLGFLFVAALITIFNSFLIYISYKGNSKVDIKMVTLSLAVLLVGILIVI